MDVYSIDLRNHGSSPHSKTMTYTAMAADLLRFLQSISDLNDDISLLGHSMGGKVGMALALDPRTPPHLLRNLIVEDISPIQGSLSPEFTKYAKSMMIIMEMKCKDRKEADALLREVEPVRPLYLASPSLYLTLYSIGSRCSAVSTHKCGCSVEARRATDISRTTSNHC